MLLDKKNGATIGYLCAQKMAISCLATNMTNIVKYVVFYDSMFISNLTTYFWFFLRIVQHYQ